MTFQDIGATPAIANGYQVRATNTFGSSAWSNCVTATTPAIGAPSSLTATAVLPSQINLAWTDNSIYESGFAVQRKSGNVCDNTGWSTIATPVANATTYSNTSLIPDRYTYRVGATLGGFVSTWSNCATATIPIATAPTLIAPSGTISTNTQSYRWTPVPGATSYRLHVYDTVAASNRIYVVYTVGTGAGQVDCTTVPGECSITPAVTLNNASHWWRVQGLNSSSSGPWTAQKFFTVAISVPGTPTPVAPADTSTMTTATPTYQWSAATGVVVNYRLVVLNGAVEVLNALYTPSALGCSSGGTCTVKPATVLANASYTWHVRAENTVGPGAWSATWAFTVSAPAPPAAPALLSPKNPTPATNPVTYRWTHTGGTSYRLHVYDTVAALNRIYVVYTVGTGPGQVDCTTVPGECSITPAVTLNPVSHWWRVQGTNASGTGPWSSQAFFTVN